MFKSSKGQYVMANRSQERPLLRKYITIVVSVVSVFAVLFVTGAFFYVKTHAGFEYNSEVQVEKNLGITPSETKTESKDKGKISLVDAATETPAKTNFLVVGVDKNESLTDSIMVFGYDNENNKISVVSIPRDTYVTLSPSQVKTLQKEGHTVPASGVMKINAVNVYGGKKHGMEYLQQEIEEILGIKIHYYAVVNLEGFRHIVDTIGGVWFDVPAGGLYYSDPMQNLQINIKGGHQLLDGKNAEGLVRFRHGYAAQDLKRVEVQQQFFKEFLKQFMDKDTLVKNAPSLLMDFLTYVNTNFSVTDLPKYASCLTKIDVNNVWSTTLPGYATMVGDASYYMCDKDLTKQMVREFFYSVKDETQGADGVQPDGATGSEFVTEYKTPVVVYGQHASTPSGKKSGTAPAKKPAATTPQSSAAPSTSATPSSSDMPTSSAVPPEGGEVLPSVEPGAETVGQPIESPVPQADPLVTPGTGAATGTGVEGQPVAPGVVTDQTQPVQGVDQGAGSAVPPPEAAVPLPADQTQPAQAVTQPTSAVQ